VSLVRSKRSPDERSDIRDFICADPVYCDAHARYQLLREWPWPGNLLEHPEIARENGGELMAADPSQQRRIKPMLSSHLPPHASWLIQKADSRNDAFTVP
jgi:hypothetical protein